MDNSTELEFRDGKVVVPEYLADLMAGFDTTMFTYQQALDRVNSGMLNETFSKARQAEVDRHMKQVKSDGIR